MKQVIIASISGVACTSITAQNATTNNFPNQLKNVIACAKTDFKTIPLDSSLKGAITTTIKQDNFHGIYYHSVFGKKISIKKADSLVNGLTKKIKLALGNDYLYRQQRRSDGRDVIFTNKNDSIGAEIHITSFCISSYCTVYLDVFKKRNEIATLDFDSLKFNTEFRVKKIIVDKLGVSENELTHDASFTNDLGVDSLDTVELVMAFEEEFNISIPDEEAELILTVGQAIDYVVNRIIKK